MSVAAGYAAEIRETVDTLNRLVDCLNAEGGEIELNVFTMQDLDVETGQSRLQQSVSVSMRKVTEL